MIESENIFRKEAAGSGSGLAVLFLAGVGLWSVSGRDAPPPPPPAASPPSPVAPAPSAASVGVSAHDLDAAVRVAIFETRGEPRLGKIAVAHVIRNRWKRNPYGWKTIGEVVKAPKQFEPWYLHKQALMKINQKGREYQRMQAIIEDALAGRTADPTSGAFYFLNVAVVKQRGMSRQWKKIIAMPGCLDIGRHRFCPRG